jgi:antitoxin ParD1/3/4
MHRKTITLTEQQENWVKCQIDSGHFGNDSEYIRHLIRQDQYTQERLLELRRALKKGEASGKSRPLDMSAVKRAGRKRIKAAE